MFWYERPIVIKTIRCILFIAVSLLIVFLITGCGGDKQVNQIQPSPYKSVESIQPIQPDTASKYVSTSTQDSAGVGVYSTGYRMGQITKFSVKGLAFKSGEGQLLMGREGTPLVKTYSCGDGDKCRTVVNPWYFSMDAKDAPLMKQFGGEYAWIKYTQSRVKSPAFNTEYIVNQIGLIDKTTPLQSCTDPGAAGSKSEGFRVGRIVKVSMKGTFSKTGEVLVQVGNAGNQFKNMSITDAMYDCTVSVLKSASKVKIHYVEGWFRNPLSSGTNYAISKIEIIQDI